MLDIATMDKYDSQKMYKIYDDWPNLAKKAYNSDLESIHFEGIDHIVFAGMGGSGAIGDLFASILSKTNIHVTMVKGYLLPQTVDDSTLVVTTSVSGNTAETLTVLKSASKLNCKIIAFCSDGKMKQYCIDNEINFRIINLIHSPRVSFITYVYSILNILLSILPINENDILVSIDSLFKIHKQISSNNLTDSNPAINLANWITGIPLIYYPYGLHSAAIRLKSALQENSKIHVITEDIIESCHNGIVAWENPSIVQPILIQGTADYIKTKERFSIIEQYFTKNKIDFKVINSVDGNILTKLISLIYLFDYSSIYRAILSKTNPSPVYSIDYVKNKI
ncbi:MAG: glucose-6-phosphate isomerase [Thaumarchaeota archaeon]|jgi:glucose/mannose-6-phosphate isomerase|nr:MAG: glucose-6-phosphate isomerase [Nitrososphaerota archaeon]